MADIEMACWGASPANHAEARWGVHGAWGAHNFTPDDEADTECPLCYERGWTEDAPICPSCRRLSGDHEPGCYFE